MWYALDATAEVKMPLIRAGEGLRAADYLSPCIAECSLIEHLVAPRSVLRYSRARLHEAKVSCRLPLFILRRPTLACAAIPVLLNLQLGEIKRLVYACCLRRCLSYIGAIAGCSYSREEALQLLRV